MKKSIFIKSFAVIMLCASFVFVGCGDDDDDNPPQLATTALYDTLGAFIQGKSETAGQGTLMIADPEDESKRIQAGRLAIRTVIMEAENVLAADPEMAPYFPTLLAEVGAGNTTGYINLRETFTDLVQEIASGQTVYTGLDMVTAHDNNTNSRFGSSDERFADNESFDRFLFDVVKAMNNLGVPADVQGQLGAALEATRGDVVQG